jgi:hypothetical protein
MNLTLEPEDVDLLERVLSGRLGDLRMEISNTDSYDFRQDLKADEARLKALLERLRQDREAPQPPAGPG